METHLEKPMLPAEQLKALQGVLLEMLLELDRICKKNNIRYAMIGGTLLGAVRHKGFIPWDDDLDTGMLREEYVKFREACRRDLDASKYFFQDNTTDTHYRWGYGRIRRKNSEFVRVGQEHMKMQTGIFIDIFPADAIPDPPLLCRLHNFYCFILRKLLYAEAGKVTGKTAILRIWYRLLAFLPATFTFKRLDNLARHCNKKYHKLVRNYTFPLPKHAAGGKREWYHHLVNLEFEGHSFPTFAAYDEYLRFKYGDYMTPPPPEERHWHPAAKFRLPDSPPDDT